MLVVCNVFSRIYYLRLSSHILSVLPHFTKNFSSRKCCCYDLKVSIFQFPPFNTDPPPWFVIQCCVVTTLFEFEMYIISCRKKWKGKIVSSPVFWELQKIQYCGWTKRPKRSSKLGLWLLFEDGRPLPMCSLLILGIIKTNITQFR